MTRLGPGRCCVCSGEVWWHGKSWHNPGSSLRHRCPADRRTCGAWMPRARERCARRPGHVEGRGGGHLTRYAMDNLLRSRGYVPMAERDPEWRYRDESVVVR
jgi:hypothetical protein